MFQNVISIVPFHSQFIQKAVLRSHLRTLWSQNFGEQKIGGGATYSVTVKERSRFSRHGSLAHASHITRALLALSMLFYS